MENRQKMEDDTRRMICDRCRKSVPIPEIKYLPKGKDSTIALCLACRIKNKETEEFKGTKGGVKKIYFCVRCRYKFQFNKDGMHNLMCPYCGRNDKIQDHATQTADHLLKNTNPADDF